jgi:hypothetical protein
VPVHDLDRQEVPQTPHKLVCEAPDQARLPSDG